MASPKALTNKYLVKIINYKSKYRLYWNNRLFLVSGLNWTLVNFSKVRKPLFLLIYVALFFFLLSCVNFVCNWNPLEAQRENFQRNQQVKWKTWNFPCAGFLFHFFVTSSVYDSWPQISLGSNVLGNHSKCQLDDKLAKQGICFVKNNTTTLVSSLHRGEPADYERNCYFTPNKQVEINRVD